MTTPNRLSRYAPAVKATIISSIISLFFCITGNAQILSRGDLFGPGAPPARAGIELGLGLQRQEGSFQAACRCEFLEGKGAGVIGALVFELPVNYDWAFSLKAGITAMNTNGETLIVDTATMRFEPGDSVTFGTIKFNRKGDISATYLMITPGIRYQFFRGGPFLHLGAGIGILLSSKFTHIRELTSSRVTLINDGTVHDGVTFENGTMEETLEDGEIPQVNKTRFSLVFGGGYDLPMSEKALLSPMVMYDFPLTKLRDPLADNWKISSLMLMIGLKYILE